MNTALLSVAAAFSLALATLLASPAHAAGEDLAACTYRNGAPIEPKQCEKLRELDARDRAATEKRAAQLAAAQKAEADNQAEAANAAAADQAAQRQAIAQRRQLDEQQRAQTTAVVAAANRDQQAAERAHEARMAQARKACGADFGKPAVGMTLQRAKQCVGDFTLYAENGPRQVYQAGRLHVTVLAGRIERWVAF